MTLRPNMWIKPHQDNGKEWRRKKGMRGRRRRGRGWGGGCTLLSCAFLPDRWNHAQSFIFLGEKGREERAKNTGDQLERDNGGEGGMEGRGDPPFLVHFSGLYDYFYFCVFIFCCFCFCFLMLHFHPESPCIFITLTTTTTTKKKKKKKKKKGGLSKPWIWKNYFFGKYFDAWRNVNNKVLKEVRREDKRIFLPILTNKKKSHLSGIEDEDFWLGVALLVASLVVLLVLMLESLEIVHSVSVLPSSGGAFAQVPSHFLKNIDYN